jgi:hypothetical protein
MVGVAECMVGMAECMVGIAECMVGMAECMVRIVECMVGMAERMVGMAECMVGMAECMVGMAECIVGMAECMVRWHICAQLYGSIGSELQNIQPPVGKSPPHYTMKKKCSSGRGTIKVENASFKAKMRTQKEKRTVRPHQCLAAATPTSVHC